MASLHAEENVLGDKKSDDGTNFLALQCKRKCIDDLAPKMYQSLQYSI